MKIVFIGIWVSLLLVGCSKEHGESSASAIPGIPEPLGVEVAVTASTRSIVTGVSFAHGSRISIILQDADATTTYQGISQPYEFQKLTDADPGGWIPTTTEGLLISDLANVFALHPAVLTASEASLSADKMTLTVTPPASRDFGEMGSSSSFVSFQLAVDGSKPTELKEVFICTDDVDYLTGKGTPVSTLEGGSKQTSITMEHALAMLVIYVHRNAALTDIPDVKSITLRNTPTGTSPLKQGTFALADNTFTPNATDALYTRTMTGFPIDQVRYAMLACPATIAAGDAQLELVSDQTKYTIPLPASAWKSGKVYLYNVEISVNTAQLETVQLEEWPEWIEKPFDLE